MGDRYYRLRPRPPSVATGNRSFKLPGVSPLRDHFAFDVFPDRHSSHPYYVATSVARIRGQVVPEKLPCGRQRPPMKHTAVVPKHDLIIGSQQASSTTWEKNFGYKKEKPSESPPRVPKMKTIAEVLSPALRQGDHHFSHWLPSGLRLWRPAPTRPSDILLTDSGLFGLHASW